MKLYSNISIIFCIWALAVLSIFYFGFSSLPHSGLFPNDFIKSLSNWDGGHYLGIAEHGYTVKSQYVFFPFYPLLINLVSNVTSSYLTAGILISVLSFLLAVNLLYQLISLDFGKSTAEKALLTLLFFPLSFHFLTVYTESLFLLLATGTFLFLRKRNYFLASIFASFASVTRLSGLAVVLSLILSVYFTEGINKKNWYIIISPLGFLLYCFYLYNQTGDFFYFIQAESHFWDGGIVIPGSAVLFTAKQLLQPGFIVNNFRVLLDFVFTLVGLITVWKVSKKLSLDYAIYSLVSLILPLFSPTIVAMPRYLITIFPIFIILSLYKNYHLSIFYQFIGLMLLSVYAILFINGYWVS